MNPDFSLSLDISISLILPREPIQPAEPAKEIPIRNLYLLCHKNRGSYCTMVLVSRFIAMFEVRPFLFNHDVFAELPRALP